MTEVPRIIHQALHKPSVANSLAARQGITFVGGAVSVATAAFSQIISLDKSSMHSLGRNLKLQNDSTTGRQRGRIRTQAGITSALPSLL